MSIDNPTVLSGMTALVTGATNGIGKATAVALAASGAHVIVHGRDQARGTSLVADLTAAGGSASLVIGDLSDAGEARRVATEAGEVDILVNNAGQSIWGPTGTFDPAALDAMHATNVRAPFIITSVIAPGMARRGRGSIINVGSMAGAIGLDGGAAYGATKAALASLTRAWAKEYADAGVRVNTVAPGPVYTKPQSRDLYETLGATTLLKRAAAPEEIAGVILFLTSPASAYITGASLAADGGRTAI
ncbi:SDR family NAD(P)-dependent oxidoreductase [Herbiconiux sp. P16]|uniref:SDR family NAD(P)-dependent oxidoreductase n=1 Tax=Herbiconiux wuyangfengii TaxID=3342794 RepID=UPI0035BB6736